MEKTVRFSISINAELLQKFDEAIRERMYTNRSKAIGDLIRDFIVEREWESSEREVMGSLTLIYDHETRGIVDRLTDIQHKKYPNVISTVHLHLDEHNCMEVLAIKGFPDEVREISDRLISCRGVKHGKLVMTSTGKEIV